MTAASAAKRLAILGDPGDEVTDSIFFGIAFGRDSFVNDMGSFDTKVSFFKCCDEFGEIQCFRDLFWTGTRKNRGDET